MKRVFFNLVLVIIMLAASVSMASAAPGGKTIGVNVLLNTDISKSILAELGKYGKVRDVLSDIDALTMQIGADKLDVLRALPYVTAANPDAVRNGAPIDAVLAEDFAAGINTWDLDAVNVTDYGAAVRQVTYDGSGVYVAVLDTGLLDSWRAYFPEERIAEELGVAFGGGGGEVGTVSSQPNKWEHDQNSHGTHVTSTILGYQYLVDGILVNGVAPMVTIIPVKVLNQNGSGWSSVVARGITYIADLKTHELSDYPVVINMSLGGPSLDPLEAAAIDYAIEAGVIIVASAGNEGQAGMGYPGAYAPVISVAASGWTGEWPKQLEDRNWWWNSDVAETDLAQYYITDFSSRQLAGQDLDVAAPGSWIRGPYQNNSGQLSYYFLGGTSMASPHVAGIAALMVEKDPSLSAGEVESMLEAAAVALPPDCKTVFDPSHGGPFEFCWETDATGAGLIMADLALAEVAP